jgi:hypothetical protein
VKDPTFFLGNDKETESSDTPGVSIKTEILEENCDSDVEIINTSKECSFDRDDQSIQNLMEESEITKTEIKEEPDNDYQGKISYDYGPLNVKPSIGLIFNPTQSYL